MPAQSRRRRFAIVAVFIVGAWAIAATSASYKVIDVPNVAASLRLDAAHPVALTRLRIVLPPEADPPSARVDLRLQIDGVRAAGSGASPAPAGAPGVRLIVTAAVPRSSAAGANQGTVAGPDPWQTEVTLGGSVTLPVACRNGPCERGFWLIAQLEDPDAGPVELDWHVGGTLGYGGNWPEGATATITIDPPTPIAGPAPALAVTTGPESVTIGPDAPAAARVLEVSVTGGEPGAAELPAAALRVDLKGDPAGGGSADLPLVQIIPIPDTASTLPVATALPPDGNPFTGCGDGDTCTRRFLVSFAWTGRTTATDTFEWTATLRRADLLDVWTSGATITVGVIRRIDLARADPETLYLEGDVTPVGTDPATQVRLALRSDTTSDDPIAALLPVPARMTYRAQSVGLDAQALVGDRSTASIRARVRSSGSAPVYADFTDGTVEVVTNPMAAQTDVCRLGDACPELELVIQPVGSDGKSRADARYHWSIDVATWSWEEIPVEVTATEGGVSPAGQGSTLGGQLTCPGDRWPPFGAPGAAEQVAAWAPDAASIQVQNGSSRTVHVRISGWEVARLESCRGLVEHEVMSAPLGPGEWVWADLGELAGRPEVPIAVSVYSEPCGEGGCKGPPDAVILVPRSTVAPAAS